MLHVLGSMPQFLLKLARSILLFSLLMLLSPSQASAANSYASLQVETNQIFLDGTIVEEDRQSSISNQLTYGVSASGLAMLKSHEGEWRCRHNRLLHCPYNDSSNYCTIGHGHLVQKKNCLESEDLLVARGWANGITESMAEEILLNDLFWAQLALEDHIDGAGRLGVSRLGPDVPDWINKFPNQYDALVSFIFNVGATAFNGSTLLKLLKVRNDYKEDLEIAREFMKWRKSKGEVVEGLYNRRDKEVRHFFAGTGTIPNKLIFESSNGLDFDIRDEELIDITVGEVN